MAALLVLPGRLLQAEGDVSVAPIALPATTAPAPVQALPVVVHHTKPRAHRVVSQAKPALVDAHFVPVRPVTTKPVAVAPAVKHARTPLVHHVTAISRAAFSRHVRLTKHETPPEPAAPPAPAPAPAPAPVPAPAPAPAPVAAPMQVPAAVSAPAPAAPAPVVETAVAAVLPDDEDGHGRDHGRGGEHGRGHGHDR